jgi:hypothetical protein
VDAFGIAGIVAGAGLVLLVLLVLVTVLRLRALARAAGSLRAATDAATAPVVAALTRVQAHRSSAGD